MVFGPFYDVLPLIVPRYLEPIPSLYGDFVVAANAHLTLSWVDIINTFDFGTIRRF